MVFKRPGNNRDGQSGRASNRAQKGGDNSKKTSPSNRGNSSKRSSDNFGDKKPYVGKRDGDNRSSFSGGSSSGEKKNFAPRNKPYTGRPSDNDKSSFNGGGYGDKKSFSPKGKPYSGRPTGDDRPSRSGDSHRGSKEPLESKRGYTKRPETTSERPKRSFGSTSPREVGFKKREFSSADKPYARKEKPKFDRPERKTPAKTLRPKKSTAKDDDLIRLNRYIANAGICSRRKADELIMAGVITVNGEVITELGSKIDPIKDEIRYNGETLKREKMVYVLLNKPKDYITTTDDPQERRTVMHLVEKASRERIYPIGRLDRNTTGLLLMTNDGDLADKLSHPRSNVVKLYQVELSKSLTQGDLNKIQFGLELEDGLIKPDAVSYVAGASKREVGIQIHSGKNRIVRRIFEHLGYEVVKLDRVVYAGLTKKDLPRGRWRYLDEKEIIQLKHLTK